MADSKSCLITEFGYQGLHISVENRTDAMEDPVRVATERKELRLSMTLYWLSPMITVMATKLDHLG
jgi:hypothetical protein